MTLKKFDIEKFGTDVLLHRTGLGLTRDKYGLALGRGLNCGYLINNIELKKINSPEICLVYNICKWMEADINIYFINK